MLLCYQNFWVQRTKINIIIELKIFLPWFPNSLLFYLIHFIILWDCEKKTDDIILGIPKVETLLEIRTKTRIYFILNSIYTYILRKNTSNRYAIKKSIHRIQRIIVDRTQCVYQLNCVIVNETDLELVVNQIFFVQIISNYVYKLNIMDKKYNFDFRISINWNFGVTN